MQLPAPLLLSLHGTKGFDKEAFEQVHASGEQVTSIRLNPAKPIWADCGPLTVHREQVPWCPHGYYLPSRPSFTLDPVFHAGAYYVQEASSMFLWQVLEQTVGSRTKGLRVLDLCAAPGGKSTLLASYFKDGLVVSNELIKQRASTLVENMTKWGSDNVVVTNNDPIHFQRLSNFFDVVVIDAPCSGSGLFRKDNEAINQWGENSVNLCSQRQQRIIADVLLCLKQEGVLIYSTCSYSKEENEDILDWAIENNNMHSCKLLVANSMGIVETVSEKHQANGYRFYPYLLKGEGFFIGALRKKNKEPEKEYRQHPLIKLAKSDAGLVEDFLGNPGGICLFKQGLNTRVFPLQWLHELQVIANYLYIKKAGAEVGPIKNETVIPHHELALASYPLGHINRISLNETQALNYLRRKELLLDGLDTRPIGWCLVTHCGLNLGWVKVLPNRINNYYPPGWRILKG